MIEIFLSSILVIILTRYIAFLKKSSLNRLLIIPFFFSGTCYLLNNVFRMGDPDIELYFVSSYVLYQIINLANTSRRVDKFINLGTPVGLRHSTSQRIECLEQTGILVFQNGQYQVNRSGVYYLYFVLSFFVLAANLETGVSKNSKKE